MCAESELIKLSQSFKPYAAHTRKPEIKLSVTLTRAIRTTNQNTYCQNVLGRHFNN